MRKNCSSNREKLLKFKTEGREFSKFLKILDLQSRISKLLEQFFRTVGQDNFGNKIPFLSPRYDVTQCETLTIIPPSFNGQVNSN